MLLNILRLSAFIGLLSIVACSDDDVVGTGPTVSQTLDVDSFDKLLIDGSFDVSISQGDSLEIIATGQANVIDVINTTVNDDQWKLDFTVNNVKSGTLSIDITVPQLERVESDGSADVTIGSFINQESFLIDIDGSGSYTITDPWPDLSSASLSIDGSGDINAFMLQADDISVNIDGSGEIDVTAYQTLDISIDGSGEVRYKGTPTITQRISGSGEIINAN